MKKVDSARVAEGKRTLLTLPVGKKTTIPAVLLMPEVARGPAALLLHGYGASKEQMSESVGKALLAEGIGSLSIDLPLHGDRPDRLSETDARNPLKIIAGWKEGVADCAAAFNYLAEREDFDGNRLGVVGYSMGSFLGVLTVSAEKRARAVVLAAGGDLPPGIPFQDLIRKVVDPLTAVRQLQGRPLLMLHGKRDRTVRPSQAEALFAAAGDPKELRWYDCGHWLTDDAITDAAEWLARELTR
jgi:uncharacterized protein